MKEKILMVLMSIVLLGGFSSTNKAFSNDVDVHIGVGVPYPPHIVIPASPVVFLIPGTYAYFAPDVGVQLFFYSGFWYLLHDEYWFRATHYNGPWTYLPHPSVPAVFLHLPPDYYKIPPRQQYVPYEQMKTIGKNGKRCNIKGGKKSLI